MYSTVKELLKPPGVASPSSDSQPQHAASSKMTSRDTTTLLLAGS